MGTAGMLRRGGPCCLSFLRSEVLGLIFKIGHVVSSSFDPSDRRWLNKEEALERIASVQPGHAAPNIRDVLFHQQEFLSDTDGKQRLAYLFMLLHAVRALGARRCCTVRH